jgi:hypothetical protein
MAGIDSDGEAKEHAEQLHGEQQVTAALRGCHLRLMHAVRRRLSIRRG